MSKLHDIPPRVLTMDGKAIYNPRDNTRTPDITPKRVRKTRVCVPKPPQPWKARERQADEATSPTQSWKRGVYATGDGEVGIAMRIGADDHKQWKSFGNLT